MSKMPKKRKVSRVKEKVEEKEKEKEKEEEKEITDDILEKVSQELDLECQICLLLPYPPILLNCGHILCQECYSQRKLQQCGLCQSPFGIGIQCFPLKNIMEKKIPIKEHIEYSKKSIKEELQMVTKIQLEKLVNKIIINIEKNMRNSANEGYIGHKILFEKDKIDTIEIPHFRVQTLILQKLSQMGYVLIDSNNEEIDDCEDFVNENYQQNYHIFAYWVYNILDL